MGEDTAGDYSGRWPVHMQHTIRLHAGRRQRTSSDEHLGVCHHAKSGPSRVAKIGGRRITRERITRISPYSKQRIPNVNLEAVAHLHAAALDLVVKFVAPIQEEAVKKAID